MKSFHNYINGQFVRGQREFTDVNPADGSVIAEVTEADQGLVDDAVQAARKALHGEWGRLGVRERAARLHKVADAIEARFDCFLKAEVADTGKPIALAAKLDVPRAAANFRVFADAIKMAGLECFQTETPDGRSALNYAVRKPLGVVGIITPWDFPAPVIDLESCAGAGLRKYRGGEAFRGDSGNRDPAGGSDAGGRNPERCLQRRARFWS